MIASLLSGMFENDIRITSIHYFSLPDKFFEFYFFRGCFFILSGREFFSLIWADYALIFCRIRRPIMAKKKLLILCLLVGVLLILSVSVVSAQSSLPIVTIKATDPIAKEPTDNGQFTVYRTSSTSTAPFTVYYAVSGTATNGLDYVSLTGSVTIPGGMVSAPIPVTVRDDTLRELPETVIVKLIQYCPGPLPCTYNIGTSGTATVTIYDND